MKTSNRRIYQKPIVKVIKTEPHYLIMTSGNSEYIEIGGDLPGNISGDAKQQTHPDLWSSDTDSPYWPIDNDE